MFCVDIKEASRIRSIQLQEEGREYADELVRQDRETAMRDLEAASMFQPRQDILGPYDIQLSIIENRLIFQIENSRSDPLSMLVLSLKPYKRLIQDYFMIVRSYDQALKDAPPSRIEAIDMGRRGLHNEGAEMLRERLFDKIAMDMDTARRLFTLICALHESKSLLFR